MAVKCYGTTQINWDSFHTWSNGLSGTAGDTISTNSAFTDIYPTSVDKAASTLCNNEVFYGLVCQQNANISPCSCERVAVKNGTTTVQTISSNCFLLCNYLFDNLTNTEVTLCAYSCSVGSSCTRTFLCWVSGRNTCISNLACLSFPSSCCIALSGAYKALWSDTYSL